MSVWSGTTRVVLPRRINARARGNCRYAAVVIATTLFFFHGRVKDTRGFLRSYRLIRGSTTERRSKESGTDAPAVWAIDAVHAFNTPGSRWSFCWTTRAIGMIRHLLLPGILKGILCERSRRYYADARKKSIPC